MTGHDHSRALFETIRLAPSRAFGSGSHPTTRLCIDMIRKYTRPGFTFLDVGTGTGILMIVAAQSGAEMVIGMDRDPAAVSAAKKNLVLNGMGPDRFGILAADRVDAVKSRFDLAVINILPEIIVGLMGSVGEKLRPGGRLICSGMIEGNTHRVETAMKAAGVKRTESINREHWVALAGRK